MVISKPDILRTNEQIRVPEVRLVGADGSQIGIVPIAEARKKAEEAALDLVEVAPEATPPVCRIYDYKKAVYEKKKKLRESKKKGHQASVKEVKMRVAINEHDRMTKLKKARQFFEKGDKVKFTVIFRGREITRPELGYKVITAIREGLADIAEPEGTIPGRMTRQVSFLMTRRKDWSPNKKVGAPKKEEAPTEEHAAKD